MPASGIPKETLSAARSRFPEVAIVKPLDPTHVRVSKNLTVRVANEPGLKEGGGVSQSGTARRSSDGPQIAQSRELKIRGQIAHKSLNLLAKRPIFGVKTSP
jgi:hypothetical protein